MQAPAPRPDPARAQVRNTDAMFAALEESSVSLSAMAASRAADAFREDVARWERTLAGVSETLERVLQARGRARTNTCTRPFGGGSARDVAPGRAAQVQARWMYLDAKRAAFPRLLFLASDDLLDVLGPGRDPRAVQPHLWKCFEGARPARERARSRAPGGAAPDARAARAQASGSWTCTRRARTAGARTRSPARLRPTASICPSWRPSRRTARPSSGSRASRRPCSPP